LQKITGDLCGKIFEFFNDSNPVDGSYLSTKG